MTLKLNNLILNHFDNSNNAKLNYPISLKLDSYHVFHDVCIDLFAQASFQSGQNRSFIRSQY